MDVVKKNLLSIIFGVIAVLAIVALFYPIGGMYQTLQAKLTEEAGWYSKVTQRLTEPRRLPVMPALGNDDHATQFLPQDVFPTDFVFKKGQEAVDAVHNQSVELVKTAEACNLHAQLVDGVLPDVKSSAAFDFQKAYQEQFDPKFPGGIPALLQATYPPTLDEIKFAGDELWVKQYKQMIYQIGGKDANDQEVTTQWKEACALLPIQMRDDRASKFKIYLLKDALNIDPALTGVKTPSPEDVWYAQLSLWVEQDVAGSIADANKTSTNVVDSAVKQLVKLDIPQGPEVYITDRDLKNGGGGAPKPDASATPGSDFQISPTGRICNSLYDVVHFTLVLNVDAARLPEVLADLERNKLMTVLQVDASSVDATAALDDGFVFGKAPVAQVTLQCEALFLRSWIDPLMPNAVKEYVHGDSGNPSGPGGPGNPGGRPGGFRPGGPMGHRNM